MQFIQTLLIFIFSYLAIVWACDTACYSTGERNGKCYYQCIDKACNMTANHHQIKFLSGLQGRGYQCNGVGTSIIECDKSSPNFGPCSDHEWKCGDCQ